MTDTTVYPWIMQEDSRRDFLAAFSQPMTARQLAKKTGIPKDTCSHFIRRFRTHGLVTCLNPEQRNSRLYSLTTHGRSTRKHTSSDSKLPFKEYDQPDINWQLYGSVCFNHRSAVIRAMSGPMQPSQIKRVLRIHQSSVKISANNIRDIVKFFVKNNIVRPVVVRRKGHLRYELTEMGLQMRRLFQQAQQVY